MSSSPFELFRRNLKPLMVLLTLLALFSFVVLPSVAMYQQQSMNVGGTDTKLASFDGGEYDVNKVGYFTRTHYQTVQFLRQLAETTIARGGSPRVANFQYDDQQQRIRSLGINAEPSDQASVRTMMFADEAKKIGLDLDDTAIRGWLTAFTDGRLTDPEINGVLQTTSRNQLGQFHLHEQLRTQLLSEAYQRKVLAGLAVEGRPIVTPAQQWDLFLRLNRRAVADAYAVNVADFISKTAEKPSEQEIKRVFEDGKTRFPDDRSPKPAFRRPYAANIEYVAASLDEFVAREIAGFSEDDLRAEYQRRLEGGDFKMPATEPPATDFPATETEQPPAEPTPPSDSEPSATDEPMSEPTEPEPAKTEPDAEPAAEQPADEQPADSEKPESPAEPVEPDTPPADSPAETPPAEQENGDQPDNAADDAPADDAPELNSPAATDSSSFFVPDNDTLALVAFRAQEATDEPEAAETPADDQPAEDQPAEDQPAADQPADDVPAEDMPTEDMPADDQPAAVTELTEDVATEPAAKPSDTPAEQPAEQPATETETPAEAETETPAETEPAEEEPVNRPFEEVRDELARSLASGPASDKLEAALNEVEKVMRTYFNARAIAGPDAEKLPQRPNLRRLADELGLTFVETGLISAVELQTNPIASSFGFGVGMQRGNSFLQTMFIEQPPMFSPLRTFDDQATVSFVSWRTDERQAAIPTLEEARSEVIIAIRTAEARKLARAEADKLAKEFNAADKPIDELIPEDRASQLFKSLGPFSWMNSFGFGMQAFMGEIPELDRADEAFMRRVFTSPRDTWGIAPNAPETVFYVVRPVEFSPSTEELHQRFSQLIQRFQASSLAVEEVIRVRDGYYEALDKRTGFEWNENIPQ